MPLGDVDDGLVVQQIPEVLQRSEPIGRQDHDDGHERQRAAEQQQAARLFWLSRPPPGHRTLEQEERDHGAAHYGSAAVHVDPQELQCQERRTHPCALLERARIEPAERQQQEGRDDDEGEQLGTFQKTPLSNHHAPDGEEDVGEDSAGGDEQQEANGQRGNDAPKEDDPRRAKRLIDE